MNYYNEKTHPKPSIEKEDFITPNDRPERQGSVVSSVQLHNKLGREQTEIERSQNLLAKVNILNHETFPKSSDY